MNYFYLLLLLRGMFAAVLLTVGGAGGCRIPLRLLINFPFYFDLVYFRLPSLERLSRGFSLSWLFSFLAEGGRVSFRLVFGGSGIKFIHL